MKNKSISTLFFVCTIFIEGNLFAQVSNEANTLFGKGNTISTEALGYFLSPSYGITQMDGSATSLFNLRGGINVKDKFSLGAYFTRSLNEINPQSETIPNIYMDYWSSGGFVEYTLLSKRIFHITLPLSFGIGEVQMDNETGDPGLGEANFFQLEQAVLLEINLHKYVRFNLGTGYRFVEQMNYRNLNQSDISGLTGYAGLKFGLFK
jgi:hypothetical protein